MKVDFCVTNWSTLIKLLLRRTLQRFVILMIIFDEHKVFEISTMIKIQFSPLGCGEISNLKL